MVVLTVQLLYSLYSLTPIPFYMPLFFFPMHGGGIMAEIWAHIADSRNISMYLLLLSIGIFVAINEGVSPRDDLKLFM